jgi:hypothetical protein
MEAAYISESLHRVEPHDLLHIVVEKEPLVKPLTSGSHLPQQLSLIVLVPSKWVQSTDVVLLYALSL